MKCTFAGRRGPTAAITARLTEPTSLTVAPGLSRGAISAARASIAPTGTQSRTRSAPSTASAAVGKTSARPSREASARVSGVRAWPVMRTGAPVRRTAWLIEEAIRPRPMSATWR